MSHNMLRPGKRDFVVCLVTLLFAWITFGMKHGDQGTYAAYNLSPTKVDPAKASWYGSHYISKVGDKFSNLKSFWPASAKELEQLEDAICPTLRDETHGSYNHNGYSDSVQRVSIYVYDRVSRG